MIIYVDGCIYRYGGGRLEVSGVGGKCKLRVWGKTKVEVGKIYDVVE